MTALNGPTRLMHWTAGFRLCFILGVTGPPPVMSIVKRLEYVAAHLH